ncbi:hypothetical protein J7F01_14900 [Streptomyces sp. ISL-22]|uniref:hypothetical protein n=1 Tax=unclassified Streptomyces TaxID=2593676 RepID=UPI001BEB7FC0|nr:MULTISPECIES: hypothetical protein [unclassified Streptomyces]MBT2421911.1 hypothetical protein [Streptomyces sp. ISL-24]MBT2433461.1 hypothetical protein [Streptomyces sp. ISL-22]
MSQPKTIVAKAAVPVLVAATVGAVAFSTAWPDRQPATSMQSSSAASAPQQRTAQVAAVGDPNDPATWKLPIEAYLPTKAQARLLSSTRDDLLDACMADAGYPDWAPAPDLPVVGGKTLTDWRYGIHDPESAAKRGYHPDPAEQRAYDEAMSAGAVDKSDADEVTLRNCVAKADGEAPALPYADLVQQISGDAFRQAEQDPRVLAVFNQWASCMKDKGYDYAKPMDASDDPSFSDPNTVTSTEIATAKADVACRDQFGVEKTWFDAEVRLQQAAIAQHRDELNQVVKATRAAVARAEFAAGQ